MIIKGNNFMSDKEKYCYNAKTDEILKSMFEADLVLVKLGIYPQPDEPELLKFISDLQDYLYGTGTIEISNKESVDIAQIIKDLGITRK